MPTPVTIILPLKSDAVEECRSFLLANAVPRPDFQERSLHCQTLFPFDAVKTLHFCSFLILEAEAGFGPRLVFEATIDGACTAFLRDILAACGEGLHDVFRHCTGYPVSGMAAPELVREYLQLHDVGAHCYFSGAPGRSAVQIQDESRLYDHVTQYLRKWQCTAGAPGRLQALIAAVRRDVVEARPENRWAMVPARLPLEVTARGAVVGLFVVAILAAAWLFDFLLSRIFPFLNPEWLGNGVTSLLTAIGLGAVSDTISNAATAASPLMWGVVIAWLVLRGAELFVEGFNDLPRDQRFILRLALQLVVIGRYLMMILAAGALLNLAVQTSGSESSLPVWARFVLIPVVIVATLLVVVALWAFIGYLRSLVELRPLPIARERVRRFLVDLSILLMMLVALLGVLIVARLSPVTLDAGTAAMLTGLLQSLLFIVVRIVLGVAVAYVLVAVALLVIRSVERRDAAAYDDPEGLLAWADDNARKYAREEGGIHTYQNHLASMTYVKDGIVHRLVLRVVLFAINVLARFWYNRGDLGEIPTIISARWVVIDGGKRLLFLDNYGGAWESYLNEFIDLAGVKGLNAIWTNSFVHAGGRRFGFPLTRWLIWSGAQNERPFKAYVRQSQIETLVWYSAYPTLSTLNINANTDLRQALSRPLTADEIDAVFQRI